MRIEMLVSWGSVKDTLRIEDSMGGNSTLTLDLLGGGTIVIGKEDVPELIRALRPFLPDMLEDNDTPL